MRTWCGFVLGGLAMVWGVGAAASPDLDQILPSVVHVKPEGGDKNEFGSGFLIDARGYVVTSHHVVPAGRTKVRITFSDRSWEESETILRDSQTDLALIKLPEEVVKELTPLEWAVSQRAQLGQPVWIVGSPFGFQSSVTRGILSAQNRILNLVTYEDFLQTDAAINPGNSGGPLIDAAGQALGVVTAIQSSSGNNSGVSFAVSSRLAKHVTTQLMDKGKVERGYLGLRVKEGESQLGPYLEVTAVAKDSPAEKARLRVGDRIHSFLGEPVRKIAEMRREVSLLSPGAQLTVDVLRGVESRTLTLTLEALPTPETTRRVEKLGLVVAPITEELSKSYGYTTTPSAGLIVTEVFGPAQAAGIKSGDVLTDVERSAIRDIAELDASVSALTEGTTSVMVRIQRPGKAAQFRILKLQ